MVLLLLIVDAIQIPLIVLYMLDVINWPWWLVLMPFWFLLAVIVLGVAAYIKMCIRTDKESKWE